MLLSTVTFTTCQYLARVSPLTLAGLPPEGAVNNCGYATNLSGFNSGGSPPKVSAGPLTRRSVGSGKKRGVPISQHCVQFFSRTSLLACFSTRHKIVWPRNSTTTQEISSTHIVYRTCRKRCVPSLAWNLKCAHLCVWATMSDLETWSITAIHRRDSWNSL